MIIKCRRKYKQKERQWSENERMERRKRRRWRPIGGEMSWEREKGREKNTESSHCTFLEKETSSDMSRVELEECDY